MPLKHLTETILIVALAAVTVVMAILTRSVPAFPAGFLPLVFLTVAGLIYAAALYPLLKRDRADYPFRLLHFVPAALPFLKLIFSVIEMKMPYLADYGTFIGWGWLLLPVTAFFIAVVWFCLKVIRRRVPRLAFLAAIFVPFAALAVASETQPAWNQTIAKLWGKNPPIVVVQNGGSRSSVLKQGQTWSQKLEEDLQNRRSSVATHSSVSSVPHLPQAGPGLDLIVFTGVGYLGTLHLRAKKRLA